jgi:tetrahydromethanopterin S-methyltransferase subunit E
MVAIILIYQMACTALMKLSTKRLILNGKALGTSDKWLEIINGIIIAVPMILKQRKLQKRKKNFYCAAWQ